jgi:hypothetical protein
MSGITNSLEQTRLIEQPPVTMTPWRFRRENRDRITSVLNRGVDRTARTAKEHLDRKITEKCPTLITELSIPVTHEIVDEIATGVKGATEPSVTLMETSVHTSVTATRRVVETSTSWFGLSKQ